MSGTSEAYGNYTPVGSHNGLPPKRVKYVLKGISKRKRPNQRGKYGVNYVLGIMPTVLR